MWGGRRENRTLQVVFLSGNTQIAYTTITPERHLSSVALTFLAAPQFASITYISFNV